MVRILWNNLKPVVNDSWKLFNYDGDRTILENGKPIPGIKHLLLSALTKLRENAEKVLRQSFTQYNFNELLSLF